MNGEPACRVCGCTDRFGCEEGCYWAEPDLCSVCSGATPKRHRCYTRTDNIRQASSPVPAGALAIYNDAGRLLGAAWHISEAQAMARGVDAYYRTLSALPLPGLAAVKPWQRGAIVRRPRAQIQGRGF